MIKTGQKNSHGKRAKLGTVRYWLLELLIPKKQQQNVYTYVCLYDCLTICLYLSVCLWHRDLRNYLLKVSKMFWNFEKYFDRGRCKNGVQIERLAKRAHRGSKAPGLTWKKVNTDWCTLYKYKYKFKNELKMANWGSKRRTGLHEAHLVLVYKKKSRSPRFWHFGNFEKYLNFLKFCLKFLKNIWIFLKFCKFFLKNSKIFGIFCNLKEELFKSPFSVFRLQKCLSVCMYDCMSMAYVYHMSMASRFQKISGTTLSHQLLESCFLFSLFLHQLVCYY